MSFAKIPDEKRVFYFSQKKFKGLFLPPMKRVSFVFVFLFAVSLAAAPAIACQIQFTGKAAVLFGSTPRGNFPNRAACERYRASRPPFEANNSRCVGCSEGGSPGSMGFGGGSFQQQMVYGLLQSFMNGFMQGLQQPARPQGPSPAETAREHEIQARLKAEWQTKIRAQIEEMQRSYSEQRRREFTRRKSSLLADLMGPEGLSPPGAPASSKALQQGCMIELQLKAAQALARGEDELFSRYRKLYDQVEAGDLSACDQVRAKLPTPVPSPAEDPYGDEFRTNLAQTVLSEINMRLPLIHEARQEKAKAHALVKKRQAWVDEVRKQASGPEKPGGTKGDPLLEQALKELEEAKKLERKADADLERLNREIEALKEVKTAADSKQKPTGETQP